MTHATAQTDQAVVATDEINVRTGPGLSYGIAAVVKRGESYPILTEQGEWVQIQLSNGQKGWVVSWLITTSSGAQKTEKPKAQAQSTGWRQYHYIDSFRPSHPDRPWDFLSSDWYFPARRFR